MVAREARASWRRLFFYFVCVAIGVGAIVALRSVVQTVRLGLAREARTLLGADLSVQSNRPLDDAVRQTVENALEGTPVLGRAESIETATMVRPADESRAAARMVELGGVAPAFPLRGKVTLRGGMPYAHELLRDRGALVRPELLAQLDLRVGDGLVIGERTFTIRGVIEDEPGRSVGMFSFGPRVLIDLDDLRLTGLLQFGSRARYRLQFNVPDTRLERITARLRGDLRQRFVSVRSWRGTEDRLGEDLQRAENYLSLVGFVMVVLGGVGVWSVTRVFVRQKLHAIAVLKCLGATTSRILAVYVAQVLLLGALGSGLGVALAWVALGAVPAGTIEALGGIAPVLAGSAVVQGAGVGLLVSLLFSLVPLMDVRRVRPLFLLRDEPAETETAEQSADVSWSGRAGRTLRRVDWPKAGVGALVTLALVSVAAWQAASVRVGLLVCVGFVAVALVLHAAGTALVWAVRPLQQVRWFALRHAVISFRRPGNQTRVVLLAVGLGAFFIIGVQALQANLLQGFSFDVRSGGADMFLIDIQPDQREGVEQVLRERNPGRPVRVIPVMRARVTGVRGQRLNLDGVEDVRGRGPLSREYTVTFRPSLEANERVVEGAFWSPEPSDDLEVSIEESLRRRFGFALGDRIRFDILGREVTARVTSVREVEWADTRAGGFMFVFRPGVLDRAPHTYIASLRGPETPEARARLQRDLVARYSNVSAIDVREVARTVESVLSQITLAVSIVGAVALFSGLLIVVGSVAMTKFQRLHEAAVFKTLGAGSSTVVTMLALEYGVLGLLAGTVGALASMGLSWAICRLLLDIRWSAEAGIVGAGLIVTTVLVGVAGVASSLDILRRKPLSILRAG